MDLHVRLSLGDFNLWPQTDRQTDEPPPGIGIIMLFVYPCTLLIGGSVQSSDDGCTARGYLEEW